MISLRVSLWAFVGLVAGACIAASDRPAAPSSPETYRQAKVELRDHVYHDRADADFGILYCGCAWDWTTRSGGDTELDKGCRYQSEGNEYRAARIEYEHIVPASMMGGERECWEDEGRKHCATEDPVFGAMYTDLHNLTPSIGEVNAQRPTTLTARLRGMKATTAAVRPSLMSSGRCWSHVMKPRVL